jgi:hypothetical protein
MKRLLEKLNVRANIQIEKEMLEREIANTQNALEWSLRF